ncbi:WcbI family polysaccharide biosynthesis putative acetyltransferase, partial [Antarctobacter heliothermus]|uniref:WcbI family polysaccharide biosynthesis putative acetyltransferase n=1 Tax=Antarctobacter heliothermus TaxID=74033 RepID=UPI0014832175
MDRCFFEVYDLFIVQDIHKTKPFFEKALGPHKCVVYMPVLFFNGLTPDDETWFMMRKTKSGNNLPVLSRIAVGALRNRLSADEAHSLYSPIFCDFMGYDKVLKPARENLIQQLSSSAPNISTLFDRWMAKGVFYHMSLHPKLYVFEDVLRSVLLKQVGIVLPQGALLRKVGNVRSSPFPGRNYPT